MADPQLVDDLKRALSRLPGVGPRSAQRMAFHMLERDREGAQQIVDALSRALERVRRCVRCNSFSEQELCNICASPKRDASQLCIVESPADMEALEKAAVFGGMYFVLMGRLSPLDGVGPDDIGVDRLLRLLDEGEIKEVILATNLTVEGEATAHFLAELIHKRKIMVSRIAHGVPVGGELEYTDGGTLGHALAGRQEI